MSIERDLLGRWHNGDLLPEEYMQLMKETKELLAQPEQEPSVKLPESEDEAVLMNLLSDNWLRNHTPHRLNQPEQPEQEPVAWCQMAEGKVQDLLASFEMKDWLYDKSWIPLYTAPPKREHLSDEEIADLWWNNYVGTADSVRNFARGIEKAHGIGGGE